MPSKWFSLKDGAYMYIWYLQCFYYEYELVNEYEIFSLGNLLKSDSDRKAN